MRVVSSLGIWVALLGAATGCGGGTGGAGPSTASGAGTDPTTGVGTSSTGTGGTGTAGTGEPTSGPVSSGGGEGWDFPPLPPPLWPECDPFAQDCPPGQKCSYYAEGGSNTWDKTGCVPLSEAPVGTGEPCVAESGVSGLDNCAAGAMCWNVSAGEGVCVEFCHGSPRAPQCDDGFVCFANDGPLTLCLPTCDPLAQDCAWQGHTCLPFFDEGFACALDGSGAEGQVFDGCAYENSCDPGLYCAAVDAATECPPMAPGCCLPFCDTSAPNSCPGLGLVCEPWYMPAEAPAGYETVGLCRLPA